MFHVAWHLSCSCCAIKQTGAISHILWHDFLTKLQLNTSLLMKWSRDWATYASWANVKKCKNSQIYGYVDACNFDELCCCCCCCLLQSLPVAAIVCIAIGAYVLLIVLLLAVRSVLVVSISSSSSWAAVAFCSLICIVYICFPFGALLSHFSLFLSFLPSLFLLPYSLFCSVEFGEHFWCLQLVWNSGWSLANICI